MRRVVITVLSVLSIILISFLGWFYQPWSPYSPSKLAQLDNPDQYPFVFQRTDEILPSTKVSTHHSMPLPENLQNIPTRYRYKDGTYLIDDYLKKARVTGLVVLSQGELVHQRYYFGGDENTKHTSFSIAKSIVATLIARALHDGYIDSLDDLAQKYAPQFEGTDYGNTSLRHLLLMSAGMDFNEDYSANGNSDIQKLFFNAFLFGRSIDTMIAKIKRNRDPGSDFEYISPNSHVLAAVLRGAFNARLADIATEQFWSPLGMSQDASWIQNKPGDDGEAVGYCCFQATLADYARFGEFYRQDGVWQGERLLPAGWVDQATRPTASYREPGNTPYPGRGYELHFWMPENYNGEYFAAGVFGQYIWVDAARGVVIAQTAGDPAWEDNRPHMYAVFRTIAEHFYPHKTKTDHAKD